MLNNGFETTVESWLGSETDGLGGPSVLYVLSIFGGASTNLRDLTDLNILIIGWLSQFKIFNTL